MNPPPATAREAIERELARLGESGAMRRSPGHLRLLRHLVTAALDDDADALREPAIALAVFRRDPATYDARNDPIVRVTVGRLRACLARHYATLDVPAAVRIELPRGGYAPNFAIDERAADRREGVAVLGTHGAALDPALAPAAHAFAERLADALATIGVPRVVSRASIERAERVDAAPTAVARQLGVEWVVEPTVGVERNGEARVSARLLGGDDGAALWVETATSRAPGFADAADRVVDRVVARFLAALRGTAHLREPPDARRAPAEARAQIDRVRFLLRQRSPASVADATALAEGATAAWPEVAATWAELANARLCGTGFMDRDSAAEFEASLAAARRALALDPGDVTARATEGALVGVYLRDLERAVALLRAVTRAAPRHSVARLNLAVMLQYLGAFDDALAELEVGRSYDPLAAWPLTNIAILHCFARRHEVARHTWTVARLAGSPPALAGIFQGQNELWAGAPDAARAFFDEAAALAPDWLLPPLCRAMADARAGDPAGAAARVAELRARHPHVSHYNLAMFAATLGDRDAVLAELRIAADLRDPLFTSAATQPAFAWLARDRAFNELLRGGGLPGWRGVVPAPRPRAGAGAT